MIKRTLQTAAALLMVCTCALAQESLRPEVSKPVQAAQELMKAGKYSDALARLREAEAVPSRTPFEAYIVDRMRGSAAAAAGDDATAAASFEAALASGRLQPNERLLMIEALAVTSHRAKDHARTLQWVDRYFQEGGSSAQMASLRIGARFHIGDHDGVVRDLQQKVDATEEDLRMLAASQLKLGDERGYAATLEKLVAQHPRKEYWANVLAHLANKPGFNDKLLIEVYRLRLATGTMQEPDEYAELGQLAIEAGLPVEAKRAIEAGYAAGKLGSGPDAQRHQRLRDLAAKQAAEDANPSAQPATNRSGQALVNTGAALASAGRFDQGIALIEAGIAKGGLKRPEEAKLHLGRAYLQAGDKGRAAEAFKSAQGTDGTADLGRLWVLFANRS